MKRLKKEYYWVRGFDNKYHDYVKTLADEIVTTYHLAKISVKIVGKTQTIKHISGPLGVHGRNSDNELINKKLGWKPSVPLIEGMTVTYNWIKNQINNR